MSDQAQKQTVLIVDDSRTNIMTLAELLQKHWTVRVANNGKAALRIAFSKIQPDIILLDVMMPEMDGYEVCRQLKGAPETKDIPVIFVTAMSQVEDEEYGLKLGAIDYITKPYSPPLVTARVRNQLELKKYRDFLKQSSMMDGLTQIANRRRFDEALRVEWQRALRYSTSIALLMMDIDHFKYYNDTYGHLEGDACLQTVARLLQSIPQRSTDLVARWGGEEFAALLPDTALEPAVQIAEKMLTRIQEERLPHSSSLVADIVTISLGVGVHLPKNGESPDVLVKKADVALYRAKNSGRNRISFEQDSQ